MCPKYWTVNFVFLLQGFRRRNLKLFVKVGKFMLKLIAMRGTIMVERTIHREHKEIGSCRKVVNGNAYGNT